MARKKLTLGLSVLSLVTLLLGSLALPVVAYATPPLYQANDVLGQTDGGGNPVFTAGSTNNDSGTVNAIGMNTPYSTSVDTAHHRLYVLDSSNCRVLIYNLDTSNNLVSRSANDVLGASDLTTAGSCDNSQNTLNGSTGLVADSVNDRLFVNVNNGVFVFDLSHGITDGMDASYVLGQPDFSTFDCVQYQQNRLCDTNYDGLAYDGVHNRLFVMDDGYRIMVFNVAPSHISNGEDADNVIGTSDFATDCNTVSQNCLNWTEYNSVSYDEVHDRLFIADGGASRVLVFDLSHGITDGMDASYVLGQPDFNSSTPHSPGAQNNFGDLYGGVAYDPVNQQLFVDDTAANKRVLVFDLSHGITDGMDARAVIGASDLTTVGDGGASIGTLSSAYSNGMAFDTTNNRLYFPDASNNRVLIFNFAHITTPTLPNPVLGQPYSQTFGLAGGQGTANYSVSSGSLPPGLTLNASTGLLSGVPTTPGTYTFEISVTDDNGTIGTFYADPPYTVTIAAPFAAPDTGLGGRANNATRSAIVYISTLVCLLGISFGLRHLRRPLKRLR